MSTNFFNNFNGLKINILDEFEKPIHDFLNNVPIDIKKLYLQNNNYKIDIFTNENHQYYTYLVESINSANKIMNNVYNDKYNSLNKNTNIWNIYVYDNIFFNLPFTLSDIIYLPIKYIISSCKLKSTNGFVKTLVHEKLHVLQRQNNNIWFDYIRNNENNWKLITDNALINKLKNINLSKDIISNPDTEYDFKYVYQKDDEIYYGTMIYDNDKVKVVWIKIINFYSNEQKYNYEIVDNLNLSEHPFEVLAYKISDDLCTNL